MQFVSGVLITCIEMCLSTIAIIDIVYAICSQAALFCFIFANFSLFSLSVFLFRITLQDDVTDLLLVGEDLRDKDTFNLGISFHYK